MSVYGKIKAYREFDYEEFFNKVTENDIRRIINKSTISELEFLALLSDKAEECLEEMAQRAHQLTLQHFGKVIFLYTPLYLANFCTNKCLYCSFNVENKIHRSKLSLEQVEVEAKEIAKTGLRHLLILTGESRHHSPISYIKDCVKILKKYFSSISIEIYPLETEEYAELISAGVDGLTIYQEVYDFEIYDHLHVSGPKKDYLNRLEAPERACQAKMRTVNIGPLLGLGDWQKEAFMAGIHANYLQDKYMDTEISMSFPRIRPFKGSFKPNQIVSDKNMVQAILATRIFMPRCGITISTRESAQFRDNLLGLGVTKMSADSCTSVGGHTSDQPSEEQFAISDDRDVPAMREMLRSRGYQPVFKDWHII